MISDRTLGFAIGATVWPPPDFDSFIIGYNSLWYLLALGAMVATILAFGLSGIEQIAHLLMPALVVSILGLAFGARPSGRPSFP